MPRLPTPMKAIIDHVNAITERSRWQPRRAILINIFRVDEPEELWFVDGKLFLDGSNGSGKSTMLALVITPVFDRDLSPARIDTAKTRTKHFAWHLTGNLPPGVTERTGYVVLEMIAPDGRLATFGYGAQGKLGRSDYTHWSFLYEGSADDVRFVDDANTPVSLQGMNSQMQRLGGRFYGTGNDERGSYQEALNDLLFGFDSVLEYLEYINYLTELRRPNIAHKIDVDRVERLLKESLPAVPRSIIDGAALTYRNTMNLRARAADATERASLIRDWSQAQEQLSLHDLRAAFEQWVQATDEYKRADLDEVTRRGEIRALESEIIAKRQEVIELNDQIAKRSGEVNALKAKIDAMGGVRTLQAQFEQVQDKETRTKRQAERLQQEIEDKEALLALLSAEIEADTENVAERARELHHMVGSFADTFRNVGWAELQSEFRRIEAESIEDFQLAMFPREAIRRADMIRKLGELTEKISNAQERVEEAAENLAAARHRYDESREATASRTREWRESIQRYVDDVISDLQEIAQLKQSIFDLQYEAIPDSEGPADVVRAVQDLTLPGTQKVIDNLDATIRDLTVELSLIRQDLSAAETRLLELEAETDPAPPMEPTVVAARLALAEEGIPVVPLYAAMEMAVDDDTGTRVEEALIASGFLNRLIVPARHAAAARDILGTRGLADELVSMDPGYEGNLEDFVAPVANPGLSDEEILGAIRSIPIELNPAEGTWSIPGAEGFVSGTRERVEFVGEAARKALRERLINEAQDSISRYSALRDHTQHQLDEKSAEMVSFKAAVAACHTSSERQAPIRAAYSNLQEAKLDEKTAAKEERNAVETHQRARTTLNNHQQAYQQIRARERWLPAAGTDDLTSLHDKLRSLPHQVEALETARKELRKNRERLERETGRKVDEAARLRTTAETHSVILAELAEVTSERSELEAALEERLPGFEALRTQLDAVEKTLVGLRDKHLDARGTMNTNAALIDDKSRDLSSKVEAKNKAASDVDTCKAKLRHFLLGMPQIDAQRDMFERGQYETFKEELDGLVPPTTDAKAIAARRKAVQELEEYKAKAWPYFVSYAVQYDDVTAIPSFHDPETNQRVDIWTMADRLETLAMALEQDVNDELRTGIERLLSNLLYDSVASLVRKVDPTIKKLNHILANIELQREQGNLRIELNPSTAQILADDPSNTTTGAEMVTNFTAGDWFLKPDRDKQRLVDIVRGEIESAYRRSQSGGTRESFEDLLQARLDYRQWYTTEVYRKNDKGGEDDLRKAHNAGSEGMKAMDLVQPMIAASRLRLLAARPDAPSLVALDEVFSNLDTIHATAILQILKSLDCDWILATEKGLAPNDVVDAAMVYSVDYRDRIFQLYPAVWAGQRYLTTGDVSPEELVPTEDVLSDAGQSQLEFT